MHVNGSHLIKNYLITFLALIRYAWFSLSRAPRLLRHRSYLLLSRTLCPSRSSTLLSPLFNCLLFSISSYPLSSLHSLRSPAKSLYLGCSSSASFSIILSDFSLHPFSSRRISNHRRANFLTAHAYREIASNVKPLLKDTNRFISDFSSAVRINLSFVISSHFYDSTVRKSL